MDNGTNYGGRVCRKDPYWCNIMSENVDDPHCTECPMSDVATCAKFLGISEESLSERLKDDFDGVFDDVVEKLLDIHEKKEPEDGS